MRAGQKMPAAQRAHLSDVRKEWWRTRTPEERAERIELCSNEPTERARKSTSARMKALYADPEWAARQKALQAEGRAKAKQRRENPPPPPALTRAPWKPGDPRPTFPATKEPSR